MRNLSNCLKFSLSLLGLFGAGLAMAAQESPSAQPRKIILLGARWCAPCMAELRDLPRLAAAAAPDRIALAWVDRPPALPPALAAQVDIIAPPQAHALAVRLGGQGFGLPMAAIMAPSGQYCRPWPHSLSPEKLPDLRQSCD
jgi:thiol-disulfide isomerase/thioredoxin